MGASNVREQKAGVSFEGPLESGYRACLWSRTASRVLLQLEDIDARDAQELYRGIYRMDWHEHIEIGRSIAIDFSGTNNQITHTHFAALKVKDAIVDQFRERFGERPSIDINRPDVRIAVHLNRGVASVGIDLSGDALHRRGYRQMQGKAPLKENLAAAILLRSGWPAIAAEGGRLVDPMCGSGTLLIEGALMLGDIAPGLFRGTFGFSGWKSHQPDLWKSLVEEAQARRQAGAFVSGRILGFDRDPEAVRAAINNTGHAGLEELINVRESGLENLDETFQGKGLLITNPPYGERLGDAAQIEGLYATLGRVMRDQFGGWRAAILTGNPPLAKAINIHARRTHTLFNGAIECRLLRFDIDTAHFNLPENRPSREERLARARTSEGAQMFANRLAKNFKRLRDFVRRDGVTCFRCYDADMPEYAFAIDLYEGDRTQVHVQEYRAPEHVDRSAARQRRLEVLSVIPEVMGVSAEQVKLHNPEATHAPDAWGQRVDVADEITVREGDFEFGVNLNDPIDSGLELQLRRVRSLCGESVRGRTFLNLFGGSAAATVYAAGHGAVSTLTLDSSVDCVDRAQRNLARNHLDGVQHQIVRAFPLDWLLEQRFQARPKQFDQVLVTPPSIIRGRSRETLFDVQKDHAQLILDCMQLVAADGFLLFVSQHHKLRVYETSLSGFRVDNLSSSTLPRDFERSARSHCCLRITRF